MAFFCFRSGKVTSIHLSGCWGSSFMVKVKTKTLPENLTQNTSSPWDKGLETNPQDTALGSTTKALSRIQWETISSWCDLPCKAASPSRAQEGSQQTELPSAASHLGTLLRKNPRGSVKPEEITVCPECRNSGEDNRSGR